jgi:hypothetical protein
MESKRIQQARKRLKRECEDLKSYQKIADKYEMSKGMIYNFIEYGDIPACKDAQIKLGLLRDLEKKNAGDRARRKNQRDELVILREENKWLRENLSTICNRYGIRFEYHGELMSKKP